MLLGRRGQRAQWEREGRERCGATLMLPSTDLGFAELSLVYQEPISLLCFAVASACFCFFTAVVLFIG